jgi:6-pyruvoyltetrahydropterin/6-carboxytetrahydropterin synthase
VSQAPLFLSRKAAFCASHRYHNPNWSDERNRVVFGPCNNPHGHGHNYVLEVTISGNIDPETGMVLNLRDVDAVIQEEVVSRLDHRYINLEVPEFEQVIPTTENLTLYIWARLEPAFRRAGRKLHRVRLYETPELYAEYLGEDTTAEAAS